MDIKNVVELLRVAFNLLQQINKLLGKNSSARAPIVRAKQETIALEPAPAPAAQAPAPEAPRSRRTNWLGLTTGMVVAGTAAGLTAYVVVRRRQRALQRSLPLHAPFPQELLDVLAAPGGGNALFYSSDGLIDVENGPFFPVVDGIPNFLDPDEHGHRFDTARSHAPRSAAELLGRGATMMLVPGVSLAQQAGVAALAGSIARAAAGGWCLSVPLGSGAFELEMARANPDARIVCLDRSWETLREVRLKAVEAGLSNVYFVRGSVDLLPFQTGAFNSAWSANGFHFYRRVEQAMVELTRVVGPGGPVAGTSLVYGNGRTTDNLLVRLVGTFPGVRDVTTHFNLLAAAGLRDLRGVRYGPMVRFMGERG